MSEELKVTSPTKDLNFFNRLKSRLNINNLKNTNKKQLVVYGLIVVLVIFVISLVVWKNTSKIQQPFVQPWRINPKFNATEQFAKVGQEIIYGEDLNYLNYYYFNKDYYDTVGDEKLKQDLLARTASESAILQAGAADNIIKFDQSLLTDPNKNYAQRLKLVSDVKNHFTELSAKISGTAITIWYYNVQKPSIPEAEAKRIAQLKMRDLRTKILTGTITIEEAGKQITQDTSLEKNDPNYKGNAIIKFKDMDKDHLPFSFDELNKQIWNLKPGELSTVINIESFKNPKFPEKFYILIRLDAKSNNGEKSFNEWFAQKAKPYLNNQ